jgi:hypothetical protein
VFPGEHEFTALVMDRDSRHYLAAISLRGESNNLKSGIAAGGAIKNSRTTPLMTGAQAVEAMKKVADVAKVYRPAK